MSYENATHIDLSIGKSGVVKTTLVDNDFEENSLTISASSTASSGFNIGGACKKQLSITLTRDGLEKLKGSSILRRKACLHVIAEETDGTLSDKGYFYITEPTVDDYYAELICYDGMVAFDKKIPESVLTEMQSEHTIEELFQLCVSNCTTNFYELSFDSSSIKVNKGVRLKLASDSTIDTYLSCIEYLSAIAGGFAEVDTKGTLKISYYSKVRKEGVSAEPDDIQDFKQDFAMSKVAVVKTSVGGFDYTMGVEAYESDYDQLTVEQYENPFLRGFISEGEESKNPNIENIFNNMASTIFDMTFYGSSCAVPARGGINLGDLIGTTREVASVGSGVVDYEAEADILVTDYTWGYQNQINFKCNASVSNINPSSSGLNKGSVYKPVSRGGSGDGEDDRLDEIANRLEEIGDISITTSGSLREWAERSTNGLDECVWDYTFIPIGSINEESLIKVKIKDKGLRVISHETNPVTVDNLDLKDYEKPEDLSITGYTYSVGTNGRVRFSCMILSSNTLDSILNNGGYRFFVGSYPGADMNSGKYDTLFPFNSSGKLYDTEPGGVILDRTEDYQHKKRSACNNIAEFVEDPNIDDEGYFTIYSDVVGDAYLALIVESGIEIGINLGDGKIPCSIDCVIGVKHKDPLGKDVYGIYASLPYTRDDMYDNVDVSASITLSVFKESLVSTHEARTYTKNPNTIDIIVDKIKNNKDLGILSDKYETSNEDIINALDSILNYITSTYLFSNSADYESLVNEINSIKNSLAELSNKYTEIDLSVEQNTSDIKSLGDRVTKLEEGSGGETPTGSGKTPIARYTNESEVVIDSSHSDILSMQLEVEKDTNTMLSFSATGGMSSEGLLDFHVFYDNSEIAFNPKFYVSKPYETISFSTSFLPISKDKRVTLSITCTTSDASINFLKDSISVSVINAELPKSDTEFYYAIEDFVVPVSAVQLHEVNDSVTTQ